MDGNIIEALNQVMEYCNATNCHACRFTDGTRCGLAGSPISWKLPESFQETTTLDAAQNILTST